MVVDYVALRKSTDCLHGIKVCSEFCAIDECLVTRSERCVDRKYHPREQEFAIF